MTALDDRALPTPIRLTSLTDCGGCAAKLGADLLADALSGLGAQAAPDELLAGLNPPDDAAVYRISDELAIVGTLDFFPPLVDDARTYGEIAAANALSDVFAMGGRGTRSPRSSRAPRRRSGRPAASWPVAIRSATRSPSTAWR